VYLQVASGSCALTDIACYVVARVVACYPSRNEFLIDAGALALHKDPAGLPDGTWGELRDDPALVLKRITQEVCRKKQ
jgi:D-serine deaminase-like pyridoxal phosphate-dependent protein